ncbi:glycerol kinase [Patescibacteria group bacterium]|nr:glycerol kinase [Patescibacteria group bacterium]
MQYILALDIGTTSTRAIIFNQKMEQVVQVSDPLKIFAQETSEVEQDANEIWIKTIGCAKKCIKSSHINVKNIKCIGITNQRETVLAWDAATGKSLSSAIVWQDRRTAKRCAALEKNRSLARRIKAKTGLVIDPSFSATKIEWLNTDLAKKKIKRVLFGTIDSWILWNLTGKQTYATESSNASRTMLMDLKTQTWDKDLLKLFKISERQLPKILQSQGEFGLTDKKLFGIQIPITGILGDQQASLFSHGPIHANGLAVTFGTGIFALKPIGNIPRPSTSGILTTVAWDRPNRPVEYAYEASALTGGAMLEWFKNQIGLVKNMKEFDALAEQVQTTGGVTIVPAFTGLAAPDWDPSARGLIIGLNRGTQKAHICRAAIEAIACQATRIARLLQDQSGTKITNWRVSGGLAKSNILMQSQSDMSQTNICRESHIESTAAGAAMIAGLGADIWPTWREISKQMTCEKVFRPKRIKRGLAFLAQYERALERAKNWVI